MLSKYLLRQMVELDEYLDISPSRAVPEKIRFDQKQFSRPKLRLRQFPLFTTLEAIDWREL